MSTAGDDPDVITNALAADVRAIRKTLQLWSTIAGGLLLFIATGLLIWSVG